MADISNFDDLNALKQKNVRKMWIAIITTIVVMIVAFMVCMGVGNYSVGYVEMIMAIFGKGDDDSVIMMIHDVRLPRVMAAAMVGAALSIAGLAMQSLFKNPMASPSILGISSGAAFGASLAISFGLGSGIFGNVATPGMAFIMCFVTMGLVYLIARSKYGVSTVTLLLGGVAVGAFFNGLVSLMQYIADEDVLASIIYWTMGSFNKVTWDSFIRSFFPILIGVIMLAIIYRELNLISAGEEQAANLGVNVKRIRLIAITATSLCVAGSVSLAGTISFVGLIVPHIFRMIVGPNHKMLIPMCIFGGAAFLMIMDTIAKAAFVSSFPVGIFTALLGAPFFVYVLRRRKKEMWE